MYKLKRYKPTNVVDDINTDIELLHHYRKWSLRGRRYREYQAYGKLLDILIRQLHLEKGYGREEY